MRRILRTLGALAAVVILGLQLLPFGRIDRPPVTGEPTWPSAEAERLAVAACYDCHSNETRVRWFDRIAPGSWIVARHVREGRDVLNFSEWDRPQDDDLADVVEDGEMPLRDYQLLHPSARLSPRERATLVAALQQLEDDLDEARAGGRGRGRGRSGEGGERDRTG